MTGRDTITTAENRAGLSRCQRPSPPHLFPLPFGPGQSLSAAAAGHDLQALYFLSHGLIEGGIGKVHDAIRARVGVGVSLLTPYPCYNLFVHVEE